jgi:voltage-gated potassium channel Kch
MFRQLLEGALLIVLTVAIHGSVLGWSIGRLRLNVAGRRTFFADTWLLSRLAMWAVLAHLLEITVWGLYYYWRDILPDVETSVYFSAVTYATIGYGDVVPPPDWRLLAGMEGLVGILMCGWSGGFFFATVARMYLAPGSGQAPGG